MVMRATANRVLVRSALQALKRPEGSTASNPTEEASAERVVIACAQREAEAGATLMAEVVAESKVLQPRGALVRLTAWHRCWVAPVGGWLRLGGSVEALVVSPGSWRLVLTIRLGHLPVVVEEVQTP